MRAEDILELNDPDDLRNIVLQLAQKVEYLEQKFIEIGGVSEIAPLDFDFMAGDETDPTYVRWRLMKDNSIVGFVTAFELASLAYSGIAMYGQKTPDAGKATAVILVLDDSGNTKALFGVDSTGQANLDLRSGTLLGLGQQALDIQAQTSVTNNMQTSLYLDAFSTGTPANGFGSALAQRAENASGTVVEQGSLGFEWTNATAGNETARLRFQAMEKGVLVDCVRSGTYTPGLTNVTNIAASSINGTPHYYRVDDVVTVNGTFNIDPTAAGSIELGIDLPYTSDFTSASQCSGGAIAHAVAGHCAGIDADVTNNRARLRAEVSDISNRTWEFWFSYRVL